VEPLTTSLPFVDSAVAMRPGHVLELCGPSGAGKTELLTQAAATCVLPKRHGGAAAPALFVDLDGCFDALRLVQVLDARVQGGQGGIGSPSGEVSSAEVLEEALGRFYLVQCHDSLEFLAALRAARAGSLAPENFRLILLDGVGAFYWLDRSLRGAPEALDECEREERGVAVPYSLGAVHRGVARELSGLLQHHRASAIAAKAALSDGGTGRDSRGERVSGDLWAFREHLPKAWQDLVTHRLLLQRSQRMGGEGEVVRLGKWQQPEAPQVHRFSFRDGGVSVR